MVFFLGTIKLILYAVLLSTVGVGFIVLATSQNAIGQYLKNLGQARRQRVIAHLELGYNAVVRVFGERGVKRTLVNYLLVYSVVLPPLALLFTPVAAIYDPAKNPGAAIERQWMLFAAFEIWLWGNVLCDTMAFCVTRNIARRLLDQLKNDLGSVFAIGAAVVMSGLVSGLCLIVTAYATAIAYVLELKRGDWFEELQTLSPVKVYHLMVADFRVLGRTLEIPPHMVVAASSYVLLVFLFSSFFALALATRLVSLPVITDIGKRVVAGDTTKANIIAVLALAGAACVGLLNIV